MNTKTKTKFSLKFLSCLLAVLMVLSSFPLAGNVFAEDETNQNSMTFVVTDTAEQPVKGATVEVKDNYTGNVLTKSNLIDRLKNTYETDENGKVTFEVDEVDVYDYTVTAKGMSKVSGQINKTDLADPKTNDGTISVSLNYLVECPTCNGTGEQNCPKCNGTGKICSTCSGTGEIDQQCPECNGVDSENCEKCLGKGTVKEECPDCNDESKQIDCPDCNGNKTVKCKTCSGTTEIEARDFEFKFKFNGDVSVPFKGSVENPVFVQDGTNTNKATYSSDNDDITVNKDGKITAESIATVGEEATITAIIPVDKENGYKAKKATCKVTVSKASKIEEQLDVKKSVSYIAAPVTFVTQNANSDIQNLQVTVYEADENGNKIGKESIKAENVGNYLVEVESSNYNEAEFICEITPAELTIVPDEDPEQTKEYGAVPDIKFSYKAVGIVFDEKFDASKKPVFDENSALSYEGYKGEDAKDNEEPDRVGNNTITRGNLCLDSNADINKNYIISSVNPAGTKIHVKDIADEEDTNLIKHMTSDDYKVCKDEKGNIEYRYENNWYNKKYFDNNDKKVEFKAPSSSYKISTGRALTSYSDSVSFAEECPYGKHTIYVMKINKNEIFKRYSYTKLDVYFGIDITAPKLNSVEFKFENENILASIGRALTFGTFFNKKIVATVNAVDELSGSGIDDSKYSMWLETKDSSNNPPEKKIEFKPDEKDKNKLTYTYKGKEAQKGQVYVGFCDKAGNAVEEMANTQNSNIGSTDFMIENNAPYLKNDNVPISVVPKTTNVRQQPNSDVYSGDVIFKFTATDADSGLHYVKVIVNKKNVSEGNNEKFSFTTQQMSQEYEIDTSEFDQASQYTIKVQISDNAGNVSNEYSKTVYVDRLSPVVTNFAIRDITGSGTSDGDDLPHNVELTSYGFYFKERAEVTLTFKDFASESDYIKSYDSGIKSIKIYLVDKDNGKIYQIKDKKMSAVESISNVEEIDLTNNNASYSTDVKYTFNIEQDFKGQIYAMAYDAVGNCPTNSILPEDYNNSELFKDGYQKPDGDIIETADKHNASYAIDIKAPETINKDKDGNPLYSDLDDKGINLDLTVSDKYSGIKSITVEVSAPYNTDEDYTHKVNVGKDGRTLTYDQSDSREEDWLVSKTDENLAVEMTNTINISHNSNNISVKVTLVDRAGHESSKTFKMSIDKTKPEIEVEYANNDVQNGKYYQDDRTAKVTIRELNLSTAAQIKVTATRDGQDIKPSDTTLQDLIKKTYDQKNYEKFHKVTGEDGKKTEYYEFIFEIPADVQGDYEITVSATDNAGNKSDYNRIDRFSVDTAVPFITVTFDNNQSKNGNYFGSKRTATVTVTDRYFDATQTPIAINSTDNGDKIAAPSQSGWSKQNSKYEQSCTIDFSKDGKYSFTVDTTDLSGKKSSQYKVSDFIIDNTDPTIKLYINNEEVKDGENRAYIDEVVPKVVVEDTNFSQSDTKVTITPVIAKDKTNFGYNSTGISKKAKYENGMTYVFNNFSGEDGKERKYDNIYNLVVSTTDLSGHTTKTQQVTFSVNRYGSVYLCKPNEYYAEQPVIQVEEVNVNPINFKSKETYINVVSSSGKTQTLKSKDVVIQKQEATDKNWYSYLYAIPSSCFDIDDVYSIKLSSKDKAKRVSTNINDANHKDISFTVDTTNPYFEVTNYIENENIKADSKELEIALMDDTSGIASYSIDFDGQPIENVETKVYENKVNFKFNVKGATALKDAKGRKLEVKITDAAGRTNTMSDKDKSTYNVRISSNVFVEALATMQDFYAHILAFWCTVAGIIAVVGIIIWIILAKKKKKSDE